ncbi:pheromone-regulated protein PRM1 CYBJADRAFT_149001 [Cyberlindnera jadinii NRRL Y-1542]|uniref:Plasma membrane fusion protein PRM1 n=1 Tax=Cyberlindnera jadinii (strain ATCC 18201 / CBS 1600 / BCRC 20928 / JCM 3617 / NBRC 0987 / NRRL Y-1542) TaxID=983966 RepID=A0A1E4S6I3_CYBJN|nr:hypothetical protein CYBJADRAFT_149001 [Cyberlindnera jadinii NRRL Y-1542]ODV75088.1 hypothetical protein CYBJADRAFT_149001 [Cyberlindnera jadinii NRRL Y-1542]
MATTAYLKLKARLSQVWLNKYTIVLILMAIKLFIFGISLKSSLQTAQYYTLSSCSTVDSLASNVVSIPHYLSRSANHLIERSVEGINDATVDSVQMTLTIAENLIVFALELMLGTYTCLLTSAVDAVVDVAIDTSGEVIGWVNDTLGTATEEVEDGLQDISGYINDFLGAVDRAVDFITGDKDEGDIDDTINQVNLTLGKLRDLQIPSSVYDKLEALRDKAPDFNEVLDKAQDLIREPFEYVKNRLENATILDNDGESLYVPDLEDFPVCSNNEDSIVEFYKGLSGLVHKLVLAFVILFIVIAILVIIPEMYSDYRHWKKLQMLKEDTEDEHDPITTYETIFNKYPTKAGNLIASKITHTEETNIQVKWFTSYVFSQRASTVLCLSLAGFILVIVQFLVLDQVQGVINGTDTPFEDISSQLANKVSVSISDWTDSTNDYLDNAEDDMNDQLFSGVRKIAESVNETISDFVDDMNTAIDELFNDTILYDAVRSVVGCVIEDKLVRVEEGLTWIYDHAEVTFPRVNEEYLLKAFGTEDDTSNLHQCQQTSSMLDSAKSMLRSLLDLTIDSYREALMIELWISVALLVIWISQVIIGVLYSWYDLKHSTELSTPPEKLYISYPKELTDLERKEYGYSYDNHAQRRRSPTTPVTLTSVTSSSFLSLTNTLGEAQGVLNPFSEPYNA